MHAQAKARKARGPRQSIFKYNFGAGDSSALGGAVTIAEDDIEQEGDKEAAKKKTTGRTDKPKMPSKVVGKKETDAKRS